MYWSVWDTTERLCVLKKERNVNTQNTNFHNNNKKVTDVSKLRIDMKNYKHDNLMFLNSNCSAPPHPPPHGCNGKLPFSDTKVHFDLHELSPHE